MLTLAISKGRIWQDSIPLLAQLGLAPKDSAEDTRKLILPTVNPDFRLIIARAGDAATFVACGAAAAGIAGSDTLAETALADICQPLDLNLARCRMIVATSVDFNYDAAVRCGLPLTVATKYVNLARRHFAKRGMQVRFIKLHGALEIAPQVGLANAIVDLADSGDSLRVNGLIEREKIMDVSAMFIINRARRQTPSAGIGDSTKAFCKSRWRCLK